MVFQYPFKSTFQLHRTSSHAYPPLIRGVTGLAQDGQLSLACCIYEDHTKIIGCATRLCSNSVSLACLQLEAPASPHLMAVFLRIFPHFLWKAKHYNLLPLCHSPILGAGEMHGPSDYTVGWICALEIEYLAAQLCLDEEHDDVSSNASAADSNHYTLGNIGIHNVVMTTLPLGEYRTISATSVVKDMLRTFPNIRVGLMVGIGGGVPTKHDIRLGDVVVSTPSNGSSGVYHHDFGKQIQGQSFVDTGVLNQPPPVLRSAVSGLKAQYRRKGHQMDQRIDDILYKERPLVRQNYSRPDLATDKLFKPEVIHDDICGKNDRCVHNESHLVSRRERTEHEDSPAIHHGTIASGNKVIRDAIVRDNLAREKDVLCFEMEAAGLMNHFPCLVIRGICDYSDSHKNKQWQGYAALTAALYAKDLLSTMSASRANAEPRIMDVLASVGEAVSRTEKAVSNVDSRMEKRERREIIDWFCDLDHGHQLADIRNRRTPGTGNWFLESPEFMGWFEGTGETLFCRGIPGAGKTFIASIVVDYLHSSFRDDSNVGVAFAFLNHQEPLSAPGLLSLLLKQLVPQSVPKVRAIQRHFIIIDALDECSASDGYRKEILAKLFEIQDAVGTNILATGRPISEIVERFQKRDATACEIRARNDDVHRFVTHQLETFEGFIEESPELKAQAADTITKATDGMFLLAYLYLKALRGGTTIRRIKNTLQTLPTGSPAYHEAYDNIMARVNKQSPDHRHLAMQVLSWMAQSRRPIGLRELRHALAAAEHTLDLDEETIPYSRLIDGVCFGLVTIDKVRDTVRLVHTTTTEYFQKRWTYWVPNANAHIATACINYLSFDRFSTPIDANFEEYCTRLRVNHLYQYAALYWGDHAREACPQVIDLVAKILRSGPKLLNAVHVLDSWPNHFPFLGRTNGVTSLHVAAYFGIVEQLRELMKEGEGHSVLDGHGRTALHWAAKNGQQQAIELLAPQEIDVSELDDRMESALHYSARQGNADLVELLIQFGSQVEGRNSSGETPLLVAANGVNTDALQRLLTFGADPNATNNNGQNALHLAITARNGSHAAVKMLLPYGVSFDLCDADNMMPLHYAVAEGKNGIIDLLLEAGANINLGVQMKKCPSNAQSMSTKDPLPVERTRDIGSGVGLTPLHFAACSGHSRMARYLLEKGANPNACCCYGETPLHVAIRGGLFSPRVNRTSFPYPLVSNDAWTDSRWHIDVLYDTIDDYESEEADEIYTYVEEERLAVVNALLDSPNIDVNIQNIHQNSPLHLLKYGDRSSVSTFGRILGRGADIFSSNSKGQTALHYACKAGAIPIVKALLEKGCSIDTPDHDGLSALHFAVCAGQTDTVPAIFRMDENIAKSYCIQVDAQGRTLLHHLLQVNSNTIELAELLLAYGASPNCIDNDEHSPLSTYLGTFKFENRTATCRLLLQHGGNPYWANSAGLTLAHSAVRQYNAEPEVLEALSDYGVDLSTRDANGKRILHHGGIGGSLGSDILNFLHDRNLFDPYDRDAGGKTPLDYASEEAQKERHPDLFCGSRWEESLKALQYFIEMKRL